MHKCTNNSVGNVYQLEQLVDNFFPYSQKQLGFDKPVSIVFQSDEDNASKILGKTAYYDPESFEIVLYTDGRHPKDVMRSLSHELVHHSQNCRGDFKAGSGMEAGYAQNDPHLRQMEREAYTKGNLIFRDFEDLIKTGKINIEIDFSDSGEPKMSLKEWKNNEINTKLMKKWGLLKEDSSAEETRHAKDNIRNDKEHIADLKRDEEDDEEELDEGCGDVAYSEDDELEEGNAGDWSKMADDKDDPTAVPAGPWGLGNVGPDPVKAKGNKLPDLHALGGRRKRPTAAGSKNIFTTEGRTSGKISVKEAKQITRRIIERVKKESK